MRREFSGLHAAEFSAILAKIVLLPYNRVRTTG